MAEPGAAVSVSRVFGHRPLLPRRRWRRAQSERRGSLSSWFYHYFDLSFLRAWRITCMKLLSREADVSGSAEELVLGSVQPSLAPASPSGLRLVGLDRGRTWAVRRWGEESSPRDPVRKDVETGAPSRRWTCQGHTVSSSRVRPDSGHPPLSQSKFIWGHNHHPSASSSPHIPQRTLGQMPLASPPGLGAGNCHLEGAAPPGPLHTSSPTKRAEPRHPQHHPKKKQHENNLMLPNAALIISPSNKICLQT